MEYKFKKYFLYTRSVLLFLKDFKIKQVLFGIISIITVLRNSVISLIKKKVVCPHCNYTGYAFDPFFQYPTVSYRSNARCPYCGSLERHRLLSIYLQEIKELIKNYKILEIAPNRGFRKYFKSKNYFSVDLNMKGVDVFCDLEDGIPFKSETFDFIVCYHVIEHVKNDLNALKEIKRILKFGRKALVQVPINENISATIEYKEPNLEEHGHYRTYGRDFFSKLRYAGFNVEIKKFESLPSKDRLKYGIKNEYIIIAKSQKDDIRSNLNV